VFQEKKQTKYLAIYKVLDLHMYYYSKIRMLRLPDDIWMYIVSNEILQAKDVRILGLSCKTFDAEWMLKWRMICTWSIVSLHDMIVALDNLGVNLKLDISFRQVEYMMRDAAAHGKIACMEWLHQNHKGIRFSMLMDQNSDYEVAYMDVAASCGQIVEHVTHCVR
jgi:hypothetical protein